MAMLVGYLNAIATSGSALITHLGLVDGAGTELTGGGYARLPVTWGAAASGTVKPTANAVFTVASGAVVAGWRGYTALTGGTNYGGAALTQITYANPGTYTLTAATSGISHSAV